MPARYHTADNLIKSAQMFFAIIISIFEFSPYKLCLPPSIECGGSWGSGGHHKNWGIDHDDYKSSIEIYTNMLSVIDNLILVLNSLHQNG